MRNIKFRVWDKIHKEIKEVAVINWVENIIILWGCRRGGIRATVKRFIDDVELMQYSGLKDKNGKEIYEGDIVNCTARIDSANMVVIWEEGEFHLVLCEKYKNYLPLTGYYCIRNFEKEVIGNIYENPELLK